MALNKTGRFEIYEWSAATDPFTRDQMTESHQVLKTRAAGFVTTEESQPDTDLNGYFYYTSTDSSAGILKYSNGVDWFNINESGTVVSLDGTTSDGTGTTFALANHKHALDDSIVTTAKINDLAVTTGKIATGAVTEGKIGSGAVTNVKLGSDLDASKLTAGTLPAARIASGAITNVKLGTDLDASKLTAGTLPAARIGANDITVGKIEQVAAHGILARVDSSAGDLSELTASTNQVLGRGASGNLTFAQVSTDQIANDAVSYAKMQNASGYSILGKAGTGSGALAEITAGTDSVLRRDGSGNLAFGTIDGNHITSNSITATQINANAVGSSELADEAVDTDAIQDGAVTTDKIADEAVTLGTKTSGTFVQAVGGGTSIGVDTTTSANGVRLVTVNHADTSNLNGAYGGANNGVVLEGITVDSRGHVTAVGTRDLDGRFPAKTSSYTNSTGGGYWVTYGTGNPNNGDGAPNGSIYLQYS
jgi:hypothetical protein